MNGTGIPLPSNTLSAIGSRSGVFAHAWLRDVRRLSDLIQGLDRRMLLHAGPAYGTSTIPCAVRNAAVHALMFEGLAADSEEADALLDSGEIQLAPAQDFNVVTPLAQVVSASMPVFVVGDEHSQCYAPIAEAVPPALRFGSPDPVCLENLLDQAQKALTELAAHLRQHPLALEPVIAYALSQGDECHSRTGKANEALVEGLAGMSADYLAQLSANQGFVLPVLMAASAWVLKNSDGDIEKVGGNGQSFGFVLKGQSEWFTAPAASPVGPFFEGKASTSVQGAIGDSAVIDFCGLGGQALTLSPGLANDWRDLLPDGWASRADVVVDPATELVSARLIAASGTAPLVHLAMLGATENAGLLGRGFYQPDYRLFRDALAGESQ